MLGPVGGNFEVPIIDNDPCCHSLVIYQTQVRWQERLSVMGTTILAVVLVGDVDAIDDLTNALRAYNTHGFFATRHP